MKEKQLLWLPFKFSDNKDFDFYFHGVFSNMDAYNE